MLLAGVLAGCAAEPVSSPRRPVARVQRIDASTVRIALTDQTVKRIGIKTAPVRGAAGATVIPYGALIYDTKGDTFTYTNPAPLTFERHAVRVQGIRGNDVVLTLGPPSGAAVVTVGASQLLGIELGIGS